MSSSQFRVGRSITPTDRRPSVQKGGVGNWGRLFSVGVVRMAVGAQSEGGGVLTEEVGTFAAGVSPKTLASK